MRINWLVAILAFALCRAACGQLGLRDAADPISLSQLTVWLDQRIQPPLTEPQRATVLAAHDAYLVRVRAALDGPIAAMQLALGRLQQGMNGNERGAFAQQVRRQRAVLDRIAVDDDLLFAEIGEACSEEQRAGLVGVRTARATQRSNFTARMTGGWERGDFLGDLVRQARLLTKEEREAIEPLLRDFETTALSLSRARAEQTNRFYARLTDAMAEARRNGDLDGSAYQEIYARVEAELPRHNDASRRLRASMARFQRSLASHVSFDAMREIRSILHDRNYARVNADPMNVERSLRVALRASKDPDERTAIETMYRSWAKEQDALVDALLELTETNNWWEERRESYEFASNRMYALGSGVLQKLRTLVKPDTAKLLATDLSHIDLFETGPIDEGATKSSNALIRRVASGNAYEDQEALYTQGSWQPAPLAPELLSGWLVGIEPDVLTSVETIVRDATERWTNECKKAMDRSDMDEQMRESRIWEARSRGEPQIPFDPDGASELAAKRVKLLQRAVEFDDRTIESVAAIIPERLQPALRLAGIEHEFDAWGTTHNAGDWMSERLPNMARLLRTALEPSERMSAATALADASERLIALARDRKLEFVRNTAVLRACQMRRWQLYESARARDESGEFGDDEQAEMNALARREMACYQRSKSSAETIAQWRSTFNDLLATMSDEDRSTLRLAYEREAFPFLVRDVRSFEPFYEQALGLSELDDQRRGRILEARHDFVERRDRCVLTLLDELRTQLTKQGAQSQHYQRMMRMTFDRREINTRAIWALRGILTSEETKRIPGLAGYESYCVRLSSSWLDF